MQAADCCASLCLGFFNRDGRRSCERAGWSDEEPAADGMGFRTWWNREQSIMGSAAAGEDGRLVHRNLYGTTRGERAQPCSFRFCHLDEKIGLATSVRTVENAQLRLSSIVTKGEIGQPSPVGALSAGESRTWFDPTWTRR